MGIFIGNLIGFLVIAFIVWRYVVPPLRKAMKTQQETIARQYEESEKAKARLAEAERKHSEAVNEARVESAKIRDNARADAQRISEEMREQADNEVVRIRQRGEEQIGLQRQQVIRELRAQLGGSSLSVADKLVRDHVSDPAAQSSTVDRFLGELEGMAGSATPQTVPSRGEAS